MEFMGDNLTSYAQELSKENLYMGLEFEEQEKLETMLRQDVEVFSQNIEIQLGSGYKGVKFELYDDTGFRICSELTGKNGYRGVIKCSRLIIIGTYQMVYCMDYSNIVSDGKNIDNIKMILFNMAMMCVFYHELAHIYKGHLGLYNVWKDEGSLEQHCLDIQTLEWDADNYAATQMADWTTRVKKALLVDDGSDFAMKMACGAIHGMMYWQRQENDFCNISNKEHLPIFYREVIMLKCIGDLLNNLYDISSYVVGYEIEFKRIQGISFDEAKAYFDSTDGNEGYISKIERNWENIKKCLIPYSVFPLDELVSFESN